MPSREVECERCGNKAEMEAALNGAWTVVQRAAGAQGDLFVLCAECKAARTAVQKPKPTTKRSSSKPKKASVKGGGK